MNCRIKIVLSKSTQPIPFNNQTIVNGVIYRWLGVNGDKYHNTHSNYCISELLGGYKVNDHIKIDEGYIIVSSIDLNFVKELILGINKDKTFAWGMSVLRIEKIEETLTSGKNKFLCLSPILVKNGQNKYITYKDDDFEDVLTEQMKRVIGKVDSNINLSDFKIRLSERPEKLKFNKTKMKQVKQLFFPVSLVNLTIDGDPKAIELSYHLGLGLSTGSGFGVIAKSNINYSRKHRN